HSFSGLNSVLLERPAGIQQLFRKNRRDGGSRVQFNQVASMRKNESGTHWPLSMEEEIEISRAAERVSSSSSIHTVAVAVTPPERIRWAWPYLLRGQLPPARYHAPGKLLSQKRAPPPHRASGRSIPGFQGTRSAKQGEVSFEVKSVNWEEGRGRSHRA